MESGLVSGQSGLRLDSNALLEVSLCLLLLDECSWPLSGDHKGRPLSCGAKCRIVEPRQEERRAGS